MDNLPISGKVFRLDGAGQGEREDVWEKARDVAQSPASGIHGVG